MNAERYFGRYVKSLRNVMFASLVLGVGAEVRADLQATPDQRPATDQTNLKAPFWFIHHADSGFPESGRGAADPHKYLDQGTKWPIAPAFIVNTDVFGGQAGLTSNSAVGVHIYTAPSDNETDSNAKGKGQYSSFNYGGCHFVLADQTIYQQSGARFKKAQQEWLRTDLRKVGNAVPVFIFFRQGAPCGLEKLNVCETFLSILYGYNVKGIFFSQSFSEGDWEINGIPCTSTKGVRDGSYHIVEVTGDKVKIGCVRKSGLHVVSVASREPSTSGRIAVSWDSGTLVSDETRRFAARFEQGGKLVSHDRYTSEFSLDEGTARKLIPSEDGVLHGEVNAIGLANGFHRLRVQAHTLDGRQYKRDVTFISEPHKDQPHLAWSTPFEMRDGTRAAPVLLKDTIYVSSFDGSLYALGADDGGKRWERQLGEALYTTPTVYGGRVYATALNGRLFALDASTGSVIWSFQGQEPFYYSPTGHAGIVALFDRGDLVGLDARTGSRIWSIKNFGWGRGRVAASGDLLFAAATDGTLKAVYAQTGKLKWSTQFEPKPEGRSFDPMPRGASHPDASLEHIFACSSAVDVTWLKAFDVKTGLLKWTRSPEGVDPKEHYPAFDEGYFYPRSYESNVFIAALNKDVQCYCLDAATGRTIWRTNTGIEWYPRPGAITPKFVIVGSSAGHIVWLDRRTGAVRFRYQLDRSGTDSPAATDDRVFFAHMNGKIYAVAVPKS